MDDEPPARQNLRALLRHDPEVVVVAECGRGAEAVRLIREHRPDIVFLDVQMPKMNGFEVLRQVRPDTPPAVIFVTAFDQYALDAFDAHALDYLLKPFDEERFYVALGRAKTGIKHRESHELRGKMLALLEQMKEGGESPVDAPRAGPGFTVKSLGRVLKVRAEEVDWIEAADYYATLHVEGKSYLVRETMNSLEQRLDPDGFVRIHRSLIINLERVKEVLSKGGHYVLVLRDGSEHKLSRRRQQTLARILSREQR